MLDKHLELKEHVKEAPHEPGVYFWKDNLDQVLYVGRAINLNNRLGQYFNKNIDPRIAEMVNLAKSVAWLSYDTPLEAIIMEAKYIKEYWPKYNIVDRDDRSFIYLVFAKEEFSKPIIVRGQDLKKFSGRKFKILGPYQSRNLVDRILKILRPIFPWSNCQHDSGQACFDYQIGLCPGSCLNLIAKKDYQENIDNLISLLSGNKKRLLKKINKDNPDQARALQHLQDVSLLSKESSLSEIRVSRLEAYDISHLGGKETYGSMVVFSNGEALKSEYRLFKIKDVPAGDDERALAEMLLRRFKHKEWQYPSLIMIDGGLPQISFISKTLHDNNIDVPIVGVSKFSGDKLVFAKGANKAFKLLCRNIKNVLLQSREEAHRFANYGRKKSSWNLFKKDI